MIMMDIEVWGFKTGKDIPNSSTGLSVRKMNDNNIFNEKSLIQHSQSTNDIINDKDLPEALKIIISGHYAYDRITSSIYNSV